MVSGESAKIEGYKEPNLTHLIPELVIDNYFAQLQVWIDKPTKKKYRKTEFIIQAQENLRKRVTELWKTEAYREKMKKRKRGKFDNSHRKVVE
jgi:hypothetical protein